MSRFTTIGQYACVLLERDWNDGVKNKILKIASSFFTLKQSPFVFILRPRFKEMSASKDAFGTLRYYDLEYHTDESSNNYCNFCPNKIKKELLPDGEHCKPCSPKDISLETSDWDRNILKNLKKMLIENNFSYQNKEEFYYQLFPTKSNTTSHSSLFDIKKIDQRYIKVVEKKNFYYLYMPYWEVDKKKFRSEVFVIKAQKINDSGLCYAHYHDIELDNSFVKVKNASFINQSSWKLINILVNAPYIQAITNETQLPISFVKYFSAWKKNVSYTHIDKPKKLVHIADCGEYSYYLDDGKVYEHSRWRQDLTFHPHTHHDSERNDEYLLYDGKSLYRYICDADNFVFRLNGIGEIECGKAYSSNNRQYKTYNKLIEAEGSAIKKNLCSVYVSDFIGGNTPFKIGDYARIVNPTKKHDLLRDRLGEILEIENDDIILGFENNYFKEKFKIKECISVKS